MRFVVCIMITNPNVKINLGLNVLRKREHGFHDLETLFVPYFGLHDTLEIIAGDDYSRTSAALFARYGDGVPASQGSTKPEGVFGVETHEITAPKIVQGISEDGKLMITIAREEGVDWDPLKDLTARVYMMLAEDHDLPPVKIFLEKTSPVGAGLGGGSSLRQREVAKYTGISRSYVSRIEKRALQKLKEALM